VSCELWFYQGEPRLGLPSFFYLLFFKKNDFGEYKIYHPLIDGPPALLTASVNLQSGENTEAIQSLRQISPELAAASLSFDTSEPPTTPAAARPSNRHHARPHRVIRPSARFAPTTPTPGCATKPGLRGLFVQLRAVAIELRRRRRGLRDTTRQLQHRDRSPELHRGDRRKQSKFYTTLDVTIEVRSREGTLIVANDKEVYLELTPSQVQQIRASPFAYQDNFPLVAGDYDISVILRNRVIHQYTVAEKEISIPVPDPAAPVLIDLIPAFESKSTMGDVAEGEIRTFQVGTMRFQPRPTTYSSSWGHGAPRDPGFQATPGHKVVFELANGAEVLKTIESPVEASGMVFDHMMLEGMVGETTTSGGSSARGCRAVEEVGADPVPLARSPPGPASFIAAASILTPRLYSWFAEQLWNLGRYEEAYGRSGARVAASGANLPEAKWKLANAYLREKRADDALALLRPLEPGFPNQFEVASGLGYALYIKGHCQDAVSYLDRAREIRPPDKLLLNTAGDCHQQLGHRDQAREAFERSLQLDAEQLEVKERIRCSASWTRRN
jgi:hypothetical protein